MQSVKVNLWGKQIGILYKESENSEYYSFKYDSAFAKTGIQVCPIMMPLREEAYRFNTLNTIMFKGIVPLVVDALPDKYGNSLLQAWIEDNNKQSASADEILLFIGKRGMGALEFEPSEANDNTARDIELDRLIEAAKAVLNKRKQDKLNIKEDDYISKLIEVGSSVGGARAKAVIAIDKDGNIKSGQIANLKGYTYYIIKFDGVNVDLNNQERNVSPYTRIEYVYYKIACDCKINMEESRLLEENGRYHFMTKRFDRTNNGEKIHMLSLAGMAGFDFLKAGDNSYEDVSIILKRLNCDFEDVIQLYRRMVFNVVGKNHDDHVKNISFLMNKKGEWSLAPAYDLTYAYNKDGLWTKYHQMRINNKVDGITYKDLIEAAQAFGIKSEIAKRIIEEVNRAFDNFEKYAIEQNIDIDTIEKIKSNFTRF